MGSSPTLPIAESLSTKAVLRAASEPQSCETAPWRAPGQGRAGSALGAANADATCARPRPCGGHHRARRPGSPCGARGTPRGVGVGVRLRRMNESGRRLELNDGETAGIALGASGLLALGLGWLLHARLLRVLGLVGAAAGGGLYARGKLDERSEQMEVCGETRIRSALDDLGTAVARERRSSSSNLPGPNSDLSCSCVHYHPAIPRNRGGSAWWSRLQSSPWRLVRAPSAGGRAHGRRSARGPSGRDGDRVGPDDHGVGDLEDRRRRDAGARGVLADLLGARRLVDADGTEGAVGLGRT